MSDLTPIAAVTAADPYGYYERFLRDRPFGFDASLQTWVAASAEAVELVLSSATLHVRPPSEPVPRAILGTTLGDVYARMVRLNDGPRHDTLRIATIERLNLWSIDRVTAIANACAQHLASGIAGCRELDAYFYHVPALTTATMLGIEREPNVLDSIHDFAGAIAAGASPEAIGPGIEATKALARALQSIPDEDMLANAMGFLFQNYDATAALTANVLSMLLSRRDPESPRSNGEKIADLLAHAVRYEAPAHNTRRFAAADTPVLGETVRAGETVLVLLAAANRDPRAQHSYSFGFGAHACPGARIAVAIAEAALTALLEGGLPLDTITLTGYKPSVNVRMPIFAIS